MQQINIGDKLQVTIYDHPVHPLGTILTVVKPIGFDPSFPDIFATDRGSNNPILYTWGIRQIGIRLKLLNSVNNQQKNIVCL